MSSDALTPPPSTVESGSWAHSSLLLPRARLLGPAPPPLKSRLGVSHRLQHLPPCVQHYRRNTVQGLWDFVRLTSLPAKRAETFGRHLLRNHPCPHSVSSTMGMHPSFVLRFLDQANDFICDGVGPRNNPVLVLTEENYILLVLRHLGYSCKWSPHLSNLRVSSFDSSGLDHKLVCHFPFVVDRMS